MEVQGPEIVVMIEIVQGHTMKHLKHGNHHHHSPHRDGLPGMDLVLILEFPRTLDQDLEIFHTIDLELEMEMELELEWSLGLVIIY